MKEIIAYKKRLGLHLTITVDDEDFEYLSKFKWNVCTVKCSDLRYAIAYINGKGKLMHRMIMDISGREQIVDHKDGNGLNNQKTNLRLASHSENMANRKKKDNCTSKYLGVYSDTNKYGNVTWRAKVEKNGKRFRKAFTSEIEAALWYNKTAKIHHGEFARLNLIDEQTAPKGCN